MSLTLDDWVWVEVMLVQSLIGAISANVRQITLSFENKCWIISVILENADTEDEEEFEEVAEEMSIYLEDIRNRISDAAYTRIYHTVRSSQRRLDFIQSPNGRIIFGRKEAVIT